MIKQKLVQAFIFITFINSSNFKVNQNQVRKTKSKFKLTKKKYDPSLRLLGKTQVIVSLIKLERRTALMEFKKYS
jgi:hypothetical protein